MTAGTLERSKILVAYNPGPGMRAYVSARPGEVPDLVLPAWRHTPIDRAYLDNLWFRQDQDAGLIEVKEVDSLPAQDGWSVAPRFAADMEPHYLQFVMRLCSEEWSPMFENAVSLSAQISANGRPLQNSRVTVTFLRETHVLTLRAALDLEERWRKRKPVIAALKSELKAIEKLGKYV
jgi:hypothetical protein